MYEDLISRLVKYLLEGIAVGIVAMLVPKKQLEWEAVATIAIVAASCFAILDMLSPLTGSAMRQGAGFGAGLRLMGGIM